MEPMGEFDLRFRRGMYLLQLEGAGQYSAGAYVVAFLESLGREPLLHRLWEVTEGYFESEQAYNKVYTTLPTLVLAVMCGSFMPEYSEETEIEWLRYYGSIRTVRYHNTSRFED